MLINKTKPRLRQAKHILLCNVIGTTKRGNLKIEVFGERLNLKNEITRIRYVAPHKSRLYTDYFKD